MLEKLDVRLQTPSPPPSEDTPWQSKTASNSAEFGSQSKLIRNKFGSSPASIKEGFSQLVKGAEGMLQQAVLMKQRIAHLEKENQGLSKRKSRKRKRIQEGGTMSFGIGSQLAALGSPGVQASRKKARSSGGTSKSRPTPRRCGQCGKTGHNARTCRKAEEKA